MSFNIFKDILNIVMNLEDIWLMIDNQKEIKDMIVSKSELCDSCGNKIDGKTCRECGLVCDNAVEYSSYVYEEQQTFKHHVSNISNNRLLKMQEWLMWSNEEKNEYKLNKYVIELCRKLEITEVIVSGISALVSKVMKAIKSSCDGPKRSRVKDGIIIVCIHYISKNESFGNYSYMDLCKKIGLSLKYASRADKLLMELINSNKLCLSGEFVANFLRTELPMDYVINIISRYKLDINEKMLKDVNILIDICDDNDILLDHTPLSIGVSCFYYILVLNDMEIDVKIFSEIYDLSIVTITKTYNKLKVYKKNFEKMGIIKI